MRPQELRRELEVRGLEMLGVGQDPDDPEVLVVYLNGKAGQWADGFARYLIGEVPGVVAVEECASGRPILRARVRLTGGADRAS